MFPSVMRRLTNTPASSFPDAGSCNSYLRHPFDPTTLTPTYTSAIEDPPTYPPSPPPVCASPASHCRISFNASTYAKPRPHLLCLSHFTFLYFANPLQSAFARPRVFFPATCQLPTANFILQRSNLFSPRTRPTKQRCNPQRGCYNSPFKEGERA